MFWQQEPLATLLWGCILVFGGTWAWAGARYYGRGHKDAEAEWRDAIKWAHEVQSLPKPARLTSEQWATMNYQAEAILRGESTEHYYSPKEF